MVLCVIRPWAGEKAVLAGHLKENDLRGDLVFIERARTVLALLELIDKIPVHSGRRSPALSER